MGRRDDTANLDKHTSHELRQGIERADEQEPRVAEKSESAYEAQQRQREEMEGELERRED